MYLLLYPFCAAVGMLLLDCFIAYGPLRFFCLWLFNQSHLAKPHARRFLSQVRWWPMRVVAAGGGGVGMIQQQLIGSR